MAVLVVTGTGTGVGKTVVTAAIAALGLARGAGVAVLKAAQTGVSPQAPGDLDVIRSLVGEGLTTCEGARYPDPLSPAAAARHAGMSAVDIDLLVDTVRQLHRRHRLVLVEGAGGLLVRFDDDGHTIADLAAACRADVVVVAEPGLGTLNATALTLEALAHRGLGLVGIVIGAWPQVPDLACRSNVADLEMLGARPLLGALPAGAGQLSAETFRPVAATGLGPALGGRFDASAFRAAAS